MKWLSSLWDKRRIWKAQERVIISLRDLSWLKARMEVSHNREFLAWLESLVLKDIESALVQEDVFFLRRAKFVRFIIEEIEKATQRQYDIAKENLEKKK